MELVAERRNQTMGHLDACCGQYGVVGVLAVALILLMPVILAVWHQSSQKMSDDYSFVIVLIGPLMISTLDSLMNSAIILPYLLIAGALSSQRANIGAMKLIGNADLSPTSPTAWAVGIKPECHPDLSGSAISEA